MSEDDDAAMEWETVAASVHGDDNDDNDEEFVYSDEEEDEENVDWEEVPSTAQPAVDAAPAEDAGALVGSSQEEPDAEAVVHDLNAVNWDHINAVLQRNEDKQTAKAPRRVVVRMNKSDKENGLALHKTHLLFLLATQLRWNKVARSRIVQGLLLSLTSATSADFLRDRQSMPRKYLLERLVFWFRQQCSLDADALADNDPIHHLSGYQELLTEASLLNVFFTRRGRAFELSVLFTALCRAVGLRARHSAALDPWVVQQANKAFEASAVGVSPSNHTRKRRRGAGSTASEVPESTAFLQHQLWIWTEVWDEAAKRWISVDVRSKLVDRPQEFEVSRGKGVVLAYVVSIDDDGYVIDTTPRYAERWSKTAQLRLAHDWFLHTVASFNADFSSAGVGNERELEKEALQRLTESEEMPSSLEAFKKHHLYCLERHLTQSQCLHPRQVVGLFKGEPVFLRKHVQAVRSAFQWRRLGRVVREDELDKPAKRLNQGKRQRHDDASDSDAGDEAAPAGSRKARALYGEWQTQEVVVAAVVDGKVPKNQYGNIELWSPAHLPRGAAHVRLPRIEKIAQELGVDFAPAVVGFELQANGKQYPKTDGIIVPKEALEMLVDAHAHLQQRLIEQAIRKAEHAILKRWERLVKRLLLRQRLNEDYGEV
ncbi:hypothetical protein PINS_up000561 [Pythium insidiosum]|nr:hypothetical protein PINS_up000561 [Pythium insidiosum]